MIYTTSLCSARERIADAVEELARLGFKNIELTGRTKFYEGLEADLVRLKEEYRLNYIIHNYFPPQPESFVVNLASRMPGVEEKTMNLIKQACRLAKKFGGNLYSIHPGFKNNLMPELKEGCFFPETGPVNRKEDFYARLDKIIHDILPRGFRIAVENLCPRVLNTVYSFIGSPQDIEEFFAYYENNPDVGLLLDLGHFNVAAKFLDFDKIEALESLFAKYKDRIFEIHISDNDGHSDSHKVTEVDSWQVEFLSKYKQFLKQVPVVLEWHHSAGRFAYDRFVDIDRKLA